MHVSGTISTAAVCHFFGLAESRHQASSDEWLFHGFIVLARSSIVA